MNHIYTRRGDRGETDLFSGQRVAKTDPRIEAIGEIDELNAAIGKAIAVATAVSNFQFPTSNFQKNKKGFENWSLGISWKLEVGNLISIQQDLFTIGADLATPIKRPYKGKSDVPRISEIYVMKLEKIIDELERKLPPLQSFILPGGSLLGAELHYARAVCRRAERKIAAVETSPIIIKYMNRLSDALFMYARYANASAKKPEKKWTGETLPNSAKRHPS